MISVSIGGEQRGLRDLDESWVNHEIRRLNHNNIPVCVQVSIDEGDVRLNLVTPGCARLVGRGSGRPPNETESEILDLWRKRHLDSNDISGGELVAFLKQLRNVL